MGLWGNFSVTLWGKIIAVCCVFSPPSSEKLQPGLPSALHEARHSSDRFSPVSNYMSAIFYADAVSHWEQKKKQKQNRYETLLEL